MRPQAYGALFKDGGSCAVGAAFEAIYGYPLRNGATFVSAFRAERTFCGRIHNTVCDLDLWKWNDVERLTREQIADRLDSLEPIAAPQPSTANTTIAPSQEGVGQGAVAVAAPRISDEVYTQRFIESVTDATVEQPCASS